MIRPLGCATLFAPVMLTLCGCGGEQGPPVESLHNEAIDPAVREAAHRLNAELLEAVEQEEPARVKSLFSKELRDQPAFSSQIAALLAQLPKGFSDLDFVPVNDYHVVVRRLEGGDSPVVVPSQTEPAFLVELLPARGEWFVSLLEPAEPPRDTLLSIRYWLEEGEWRATMFQIGLVRMGGKTAPEWFEAAQRHAAQGEAMAAYIRLQLAGQCLRPSPFITYAAQSEMGKLAGEVHEQVQSKHDLPMPLEGVDGAPLLYRIDVHTSRDAVHPAVLFVTDVALENEAALRAQAEAIVAALGDTFPGLLEGFPGVWFQAFNEEPGDPAKEYRSANLLVALPEEDTGTEG